MDVSTETKYNTTVLDAVARARFGANIAGVSVNSSGSVIHFTAESSTLANQATALFGNMDTLTLTANKTQIQNDDVDTATITHNTADASVNWYWIAPDGALIGQGTENSVSGVVTLEMSTTLEGLHTIYIARNQGTYATGSIQIEVV